MLPFELLALLQILNCLKVSKDVWRWSAVLPSMERFSNQHGGLLQAPEGWEVLLWRHHRHWGPTHQGSQDDSLRVQSILQEPSRAESCQTSHHHPQRCSLQPPHRHPRVYVRRGSECCSGAVLASIFLKSCYLVNLRTSCPHSWKLQRNWRLRVWLRESRGKTTPCRKFTLD